VSLHNFLFLFFSRNIFARVVTWLVYLLVYLQNLLECQFDCNVKFKEKINMIPSSELRCMPIGRDFTGKAYWFQVVNSTTNIVFVSDFFI